MSSHIRYCVSVSVFLFAILFFPGGQAADGHDHHGSHNHHVAQANSVQPGYTRSLHHYHIPDITLLNQDGEAENAASLLDRDGPMLVNVIFTTCTSVCPVMTTTFSQAHKAFGADADRLTMLSITNDPTHDTPAVLKAYMRTHNVPAGWRFITGDERAITKVLLALDAYRGGKMNHLPLTFLRAGRGEPWVRLEGLASGSQLVNEYRKLVH